jgi:hypothetical protein
MTIRAPRRTLRAALIGACTAAATFIAACGGDDTSFSPTGAPDASLPDASLQADAAGQPDAAPDGTAPLSCATGSTACNGTCVTTTNDPNHCGACGTVCASGQVCSASTCTVTCATGETACMKGLNGSDAGYALGGSCENLQNDPENCGGCGKACGAGEVCTAGACTALCPAGLTPCSGGGDAGAGSSDGGDAGDGGSLSCVDAINDVNNCGGCNIACGIAQVCSAGTCADQCAQGLVECGGKCVDPTTAGAFCGATLGCGVKNVGSAGTVCAAGQVCSNGTCALTCQQGLVNCNGTCVDPDSNGAFCGAAGSCVADGNAGDSPGAVCAAGQVCNGGTCQLTCQQGLVDCNGTCVDPKTSGTHCGATLACGTGGVGVAGTVCAAGNVCSAGTCQLTCQQGLIDCGGTCVDPKSNGSFCGATLACGAGGVGTSGSACSAGR